jgi:two-component system cell cycle sensor histidine kinase/response regulator CckA
MELCKQSQTILVVDDHCAISKLVRLFLELEGYTVLTADNVESAMNVYREHQAAVALLLTDVEMPNGSGLDLADRILQLEPGLRILFMSALDGDRRGFGCVAKPFTQAQLIGRVSEALAFRPESLRGPVAASAGP